MCYARYHCTWCDDSRFSLQLLHGSFDSFSVEWPKFIERAEQHTEMCLHWHAIKTFSTAGVHRVFVFFQSSLWLLFEWVWAVEHSTFLLILDISSRSHCHKTENLSSFSPPPSQPDVQHFHVIMTFLSLLRQTVSFQNQTFLVKTTHKLLTAVSRDKSWNVRLFFYPYVGFGFWWWIEFDDLTIIHHATCFDVNARQIPNLEIQIIYKLLRLRVINYD